MRNYLKINFIPIYIGYLFYILKHKRLVGRACFQHGLYWQGIVHDLQKFNPVEFFPYAINYHGPWKKDDRPQWLTRDYDKAWLHHYSCKLGKHHWLHWNGQDMPDKYILEMKCDFIGTGMSIHGRDESVEWYSKNRCKMNLHPNVQKKLDYLLSFK